MKLRCMTFNLRFDNPDDGDNSWPNRKDAVKAVVGRHDPAILCTQEGLEHMLEWLAAVLPEYTRVGSGREADGSGEHTAIFIKSAELDILDSGQFWVSPEPGVAGSKAWNTIFPRCCTWCRVADKGGANAAVVFNTHLDNRRRDARLEGGAILRRMIAQIVTDAGGGQALPALLCGDFNAFPDSTEVADFCRDRDTILLSGCDDNMSGTYHAFRGKPWDRPIDYILGSERVSVSDRYVDDRKYGDRWPSDHFPVIGTVEFAENAGTRVVLESISEPNT